MALSNAPDSTVAGAPARRAPRPPPLAQETAARGTDADVTGEQMRACSRQLAAGVCVVTTCDAFGRPYGLTMSAVLCASLDPALFLISIAETSETLAPLLDHGAFAINILSADQQALAQTFASKGGCDKFKHIAHRLGTSHRLPLLCGVLATVECRLAAAYPCGDHRLVVGEVRALRANAGRPLLRYDGCYAGIDAGA